MNSRLSGIAYGQMLDETSGKAQYIKASEGGMLHDAKA